MVGEQKIPAHRIVICSWSETFKAMLENDVWRESHQQELPVSPEDPDLFKLLLQFMVITFQNFFLLILHTLKNFFRSLTNS